MREMKVGHGRDYRLIFPDVVQALVGRVDRPPLPPTADSALPYGAGVPGVRSPLALHPLAATVRFGTLGSEIRITSWFQGLFAIFARTVTSDSLSMSLESLVSTSAEIRGVAVCIHLVDRALISQFPLCVRRASL